MIDGLLVPAGCLINGETITRHEAANERDELEFFHIKLESHDVIYAEEPVPTRCCGWMNARSISLTISVGTDSRPLRRPAAPRAFPLAGDAAK